MATKAMTDPEISELATPKPVGEVAACGCIWTPDRLYPCDACRAEVLADLDEIYGRD
jgi:hypothetical protein